MDQDFLHERTLGGDATVLVGKWICRFVLLWLRDAQAWLSAQHWRLCRLQMVIAGPLLAPCKHSEGVHAYSSCFLGCNRGVTSTSVAGSDSLINYRCQSKLLIFSRLLRLCLRLLLRLLQLIRAENLAGLSLLSLHFKLLQVCVGLRGELLCMNWLFLFTCWTRDNVCGCNNADATVRSRWLLWEELSRTVCRYLLRCYIVSSINCEWCLDLHMTCKLWRSSISDTFALAFTLDISNSALVVRWVTKWCWSLSSCDRRSLLD